MGGVISRRIEKRKRGGKQKENTQAEKTWEEFRVDRKSRLIIDTEKRGRKAEVFRVRTFIKERVSREETYKKNSSSKKNLPHSQQQTREEAQAGDLKGGEAGKCISRLNRPSSQVRV